MRVSLALLTDTAAVNLRRERGMEPAVKLNDPALPHDDAWIFVNRADYESRIAELEAEGACTSDAQGIADAELLAWYGVRKREQQ